MPFPVPDGRLAASAVDEIYGISDAMAGCEFFLAEWRPGKRHLYKHGEDDSGESSLMEKSFENGKITLKRKMIIYLIFCNHMILDTEFLYFCMLFIFLSV